MFRMVVEVTFIFSAQGLAVDDQQILGIAHFCRLGEVEAAGNDPAHVDDHHLVVRNGVGAVYEHGDARIA